MGASAPDPSAPLDINAASAEQIDAVPALQGHGFEIVRYREERGRFTALRQLEEVPGMAGKTAGLASVIRC
ncbi:ComEA family DNA-binding protein [Sphingomonas sp. CCH5-D11]|uniref:ComEA family DNA-binding protein n=1 Tax=Sphingomonas sp. CCH5-D11 TaxID=1768786 RepID=UPI00082DE8A8|nr:helix-hairpin-helix domain-containing protein [Sphingomonas sp. CCH5-D11]